MKSLEIFADQSLFAVELGQRRTYFFSRFRRNFKNTSMATGSSMMQLYEVAFEERTPKDPSTSLP
jgi:hypothetical protein